LLSVIFAAIAREFKNEALWTSLLPLTEKVSDDGRQALNRYARVAFLERKILTWPSQQAGIAGIASEGSFALCTPTGSGKTRVAELVILRHLFGHEDRHIKNDAPLILYLTPSKALSSEVESNIARSLRNIRATSVVVTSLYGGNDFGPSDLTNIAEQPIVLISTHEKADALLRLLGQTMLKKLSCVIIDEAHSVAFTGDYEALATAQSRSLRLEGLVSRLKTLCSPHTTFVALSAVATDIRDVLSAWMTGKNESRAIAPDYRSTRQLFGQLWCSDNGVTTIRYDVLDGQRLLVNEEESAPYVANPFPPHPPVIRAFKKDDSVEKRMRAHLLWAAMHFARPLDGKRHSVLISVTEHPEQYAETFIRLLTDDWADIQYPDFFGQPKRSRDQALLSRCLASCADYFGPISREHRLLQKGIVLHHGKMPPVMSRLLIELIEEHVINIVIATSTLSEGVNLPFETILIPSLLRFRQPVNSRQPVTSREIINVAGRAGRPGVSTEGKTLVLLSTNALGEAQKISQEAYEKIIRAMTERQVKNVKRLNSPLYALTIRIENLWSRLSGSKDINQFIAWLERTAFSSAQGEEGNLLRSLDTLDQQLLTSIVELEGLNPEANMEDSLRSLWHNTLAFHCKMGFSDSIAEKIFLQRGKAITEFIYPEKQYRRALYHTGLAPRDGKVLISKLSNIKTIMTKAVDFVTWNDSERINNITSLVEAISQIEAFGVRDLTSGKSTVAWQDVLTWWMAPYRSDRIPSGKSVSRWYDFASKYFIYGLNWALGSAIGSILEHDGGDGDFLERWRRCELPWSVLWYKDMISWGMLDPIATHLLTRKEAYTRPDAAVIAKEYWNNVGEISDAVLEPRLVDKWIFERKDARATIEDERYPTQRKIPVTLVDDFSTYTGPKLRILPVKEKHHIDWYDQAGYRLAESSISKDWPYFLFKDTDFFLDPQSSIVTWQDYL